MFVKAQEKSDEREIDFGNQASIFGTLLIFMV